MTIGVGIATGVLAVLGLAGLLAIDVVLQSSGCGSVDPTDPANYSVVRVGNDTSSTVTIGDCEGAYCNPADNRALLPDEAIPVRGECAASPGSGTSYRVTNADGTQLGFIVIDTPRSRDDLTAKVSDASPDRSTATPLS